MTMLYGIALLAFGYLLGSLPLSRGFAQLCGINLAAVGTRNVSVSAAFKEGGPLVGLGVVTIEIGRGILPVLLARYWELPSAWAVLGLVPLVLARYAVSRGGGVTNVTWAMAVYSLPLTASVAITGLGILVVTRSRHWAVRGGSLSAVLWCGLWIGSFWDTAAMVLLAIAIIVINVLQVDDMSPTLWPLAQAQDPHQVGDKAARLARLKQAGFTVPDGSVLLPTASSLTALRTLSPAPSPETVWIARSSALGEDSDSSSAAGQYQTIGDIMSWEALEAAVQLVRESYQDPQAATYRQQRQLTETGMAVLLQQQVQGVVSGVAFSRNPLDGGGQIIVEAIAGGASGVVSGQQTPTHLEIDRESEHLLPDQSLVTDSVLKTLVDTVKQIEALFHGIPQDIEWTWDGTTVWILQSRPITNLRPIWTRTIAAEVIPGVIPPLTWSINRPLTCGVWGDVFTIVLGDAVRELDFTETATLWQSHAYFNATLLGEIFRQMGLPEQGLEFLVRQQKMGKPPRSAYSQLLKCLPGLWQLIQRERQLPQAFAQDQTDYFQPVLETLDHQSLEDLTTPELMQLVEHIQDLLKKATFYNIVGPIGLAIRRAVFKVSDEWLTDRTSSEILALQGLRQLASQIQGSLDPSTPSALRADQARARLQQDPYHSEFERILSIYGFLSEVGTDIAVACWREQPDSIRQLVINLALQTDPQTSATPPSFTLGQSWRAQFCQPRLDLKGDIATVYARLLAHLRWTFVELERRWLDLGLLTHAGDIFYLPIERVQAIVDLNPTERLACREQIQAEIQANRDQFEQDSHCQIPPVVYGSVFPRTPDTSTITTDTQLTGIPASTGQAIGTAVIIRSLSGTDLTTLPDDAIIVVPYTDAGWAPLLASAKAIIAEVGGQLSHGAILAREYRIPAVMNVDNATRRFQNGQRIRVDGYQGVVEILSSETNSLG